MSEILILLLLGAIFVAVIAMLFMLRSQPARNAQMLEQQHRAMLADLNNGLNSQGDRIRAAMAEELRAMRDAINGLQAKQDALRTEMLAQTLEKLAEQGRADQKLIQESFNNASQHLRSSIETLSKTVDGRLEQIGGKVN